MALQNKCTPHCARLELHAVAVPQAVLPPAAVLAAAVACGAKRAVRGSAGCGGVRHAWCTPAQVPCITTPAGARAKHERQDCCCWRQACRPWMPKRTPGPSPRRPACTCHELALDAPTVPPLSFIVGPIRSIRVAALACARQGRTGGGEGAVEGSLCCTPWVPLPDCGAADGVPATAPAPSTARLPSHPRNPPVILSAAHSPSYLSPPGK